MKLRSPRIGIIVFIGVVIAMALGVWFDEFVERFQTLIVGVFGFIGVIVTLLFNARTVRNDRLETLKQERQAIRTALLEELKILKASVEDGIQRIEEPGDYTGVIVPTDPISDVYNTVLPKLGLLTPKQVENVLWAYLSIQQFRINLILLPGTKILDEHRVQMPREAFDNFLKMQNELLPLIDKAITSLPETG